MNQAIVVLVKKTRHTLCDMLDPLISEDIQKNSNSHLGQVNQQG